MRTRAFSLVRSSSPLWVRLSLLLCSIVLTAASFAQPAPNAPASTPLVPKDRQATNIAIITIRGPIDSDGVTATSVQRRIRLAERAGADALIFEIDSPGGALDGVLRICNAIKRSSVQNSAAWINPDAYSGGAVIALACRRILINDPVSFGDAMPITGAPLIGMKTLTPEQLKKALPPLLAEVLDSARRHNQHFGQYIWDEYLVQAIVANDVELWYALHKPTNARVCIDRAEFNMLFPGQDSGGPTRLVGVPGAAQPPTENSPQPQPGVPAGSQKMAMVGADVESRQTVASQRPPISPTQAGNWELLAKATDGTAPATFKASDMVFFGLASNEMPVSNGQPTLAPIRSDADLLAFFQGKHILRYDSDWSEALVLFLTNWVVRGLLVVVFLIALFVEMTHPGAMVPGGIALIALIALVAPPMLIGMSGWWAIAAILLGLGLLVLEIFIFPGFGVPGVLGLALLFAGLVGTFLPRGDGFFPGMGDGGRSALHGSTVVLLAMFTAGVGIYLIAKHFKSLPILGRLVLHDAGTTEDSESFLADAMIDPAALAVRTGDVGTTITPMRPAGRVEFGERVIDAVAEFGFIPAGRSVRVVVSDGFKVGVEELRTPPASSPPSA